jgi:plasmid stability protein
MSYKIMKSIPMNIKRSGRMSNLQIKGIDARLYEELKKRAADENRSVSQHVLFLIRNHLSKGRRSRNSVTPAQTLRSLAGTWEDSRSASKIVADLRSRRRFSQRPIKDF